MADRNSPGSRVCVVGAGVLGMIAMKNFREQGLNVTAFTKDNAIGGLWHFDDDKTKLTAVAKTTMNTSRQVNCATDFPMPEDYPAHPNTEQLDRYWKSYAEHFDLLPCINFSELVTKVCRDEADRGWNVMTKNVKTGKEETHHFDKVALATGILNEPRPFAVAGKELFEGEIMHSKEFKRPEEYKGKNVLVVGGGATGVDAAVFLTQAEAKKVYLSHRGQFWVLPRMADGVPFDASMSFRVMNIVRWIASCSTRFCAFLMAKGLMSAQMKAFPFLKDHPSWSASLRPASIYGQVPLFSDHLPYYLRDGQVEAVRGVETVCGPRSVKLSDGKVVEDLDAIIYCTGYSYDYSVIQGKGDPTDPAFAPDGYKRLLSAKCNHDQQRMLRLFHGIISEQYPDSLAIFGHALVPGPPFTTADLYTMAVGSVWSGSFPTPTQKEMGEDINGHYDYICSVVERQNLHYFGMRLNARAATLWFHKAAGTGVMERLGAWGWKGWKMWWADSKLYKLCYDGVNAPAILRLFDEGRGRRPWSGARACIEQTNEQIKQMGDAWKKEQAEKKSK